MDSFDRSITLSSRQLLGRRSTVFGHRHIASLAGTSDYPSFFSSPHSWSKSFGSCNLKRSVDTMKRRISQTIQEVAAFAREWAIQRRRYIMASRRSSSRSSRNGLSQADCLFQILNSRLARILSHADAHVCL